MSANAVAVRETLDAVVQELKALDLNNLSAAGRHAKMVGIIALCGAILGAGYWFMIRGEVAQYHVLKLQQHTLKQTFMQKKGLAVNLPAYVEQMKEMKQTFGVMLQQLPNGSEVPDLLVDISQAALGRGLKIVTFAPQAEKPVNFYAEDPIQITVKGSYHELGEFVSDLSALPRIVTVDDIQISQISGKADELTMALIAKTYRYKHGAGK